jgi:predicted O-methyltransferase YrrM
MRGYGEIMTQYKFTESWSNNVKPLWDSIFDQLKASTILEVGSFEGGSTCYLIEKIGLKNDLEIHCIDTWLGGIEHQGKEMSLVESNFDHNTNLAISKVKQKITLKKHKNKSELVLSSLLAEGREKYFDFIYIDGSHQAPDVLCDAILGFKLLKRNGVMVFDDYLWSENLPGELDPLKTPKPAIDAFVNIHIRELNILPAPLYQLFIQKK